MSGGGPLNSTMMQTMHTLPPGIGGGVVSGYGPQSSQHPEVRQPMNDHSTYKTSVGFFNQTSRNNAGSTPINTQHNYNSKNTQAHVPSGPHIEATQKHLVSKKQYIEKMEESRRRHSSVVRNATIQSTSV